MRQRKPVTRTQSAPHRPGHPRQVLKRQTSSEALPTADTETQQLQITFPERVSSPGGQHLRLLLPRLFMPLIRTSVVVVVVPAWKC